MPECCIPIMVACDEELWDLAGTTAWIQKHAFKRVALQFPDEMLHQAHTVYYALRGRIRAVGPAVQVRTHSIAHLRSATCHEQQIVASHAESAIVHDPGTLLCSSIACVQVYLLADTTFNSLAVDEVAAEHAACDCIVHYGHATLGAVRGTPAYFVLPRAAASTNAICAAIQEFVGRPEVGTRDVVVLLDLALMHLRSDHVAQAAVRCVQPGMILHRSVATLAFYAVRWPADGPCQAVHVLLSLGWALFRSVWQSFPASSPVAHKIPSP